MELQSRRDVPESPLTPCFLLHSTDHPSERRSELEMDRSSSVAGSFGPVRMV